MQHVPLHGAYIQWKLITIRGFSQCKQRENRYKTDIIKCICYLEYFPKLLNADYNSQNIGRLI